MTVKKWKRILAIVRSMRKGATISDACKAAKISRVQFWSWRKADERLNNLIVRLQESQIESVEGALFKRATGFNYLETTKERFNKEVLKEMLGNDKVSSKMVVTKTVTKFVPPDTTACIFILCNRRPDMWRNVNTVINNTNINKVSASTLPAKNLSDDELDGIINNFNSKR